MKFLLSNKIIKPGNSFNKDFSFSSFKERGWSILYEKKTKFFNQEKQISFIDGYVRNFDFPIDEIENQLNSSLDFLSDNWPVGDNITGTFSVTNLDKKSGELILCNDPIGIYPLYYCIEDEKVLISNSIIWLGAISGNELDETGVFQKAHAPEFSNIGSRTILKNCKRLLPGEWLKINNEGKVIERKFDNSLFQNIQSNLIEDEEINGYWSCFKKEVEYCLSDNDLNIALSGGLDSRILLGAIPQGKNLNCLTYGEQDNYESILAKQLAKLKKAKHQSYSNSFLHFPPSELLKSYVKKTEAVYLNSWLEILENIQPNSNEIMLLGDMTESLQGRNIPLSTDKKSILNYRVLEKPYDFRKKTATNSEFWQKNVLNSYLRRYNRHNIIKLGLNIEEQDLRNNLKNDLEEIFGRIETHKLPFLELNSELFSWYTHARHPMGRQILIGGASFKSICPAMSVQILRQTSNIHPNNRIYGRFFKQLFSSEKDLRYFRDVPTAQIPLIPFNWPEFFKLPMWAFRKWMDNFFIKRLMEKRNPNLRYRLFKSNNWVQVYQNLDLEKNLNDYFKNNHLGEYANQIKNQALQRRDLKQWPFANMNIINAAALNMEIDLIKSYREC